MSKIIEAMEFAIEAHKEQKREDGKDFIEHPIAVYNILREITNDEEVLCAALLHDVLEDTPSSYWDIKKYFGKNVAELVMEVTKESDGTFPRLKTQKGLMIKLADRLHNISDMKGWKEKRIKKYIGKSINLLIDKEKSL
jgi:GTP pyrophosphokinase